jgi:hypothetical protein
LPGYADLFRGGGADPLDQRRVVHCAEPDVVREERRADDVRVAVHRVGAPDHRDPDAAVRGVDRGRIERVGRLEPFGRGREVVAAGPAVAAVEHRAEIVLAHVVGGDAAQVRLDQLADLLLERHPPEQ